MKSLVFETPVNSTEELVVRISAAAGEIRNTPEMLSNVRRSMKRRCEACITCGGPIGVSSRPKLTGIVRGKAFLHVLRRRRIGCPDSRRCDGYDRERH
ncbi:hypothetical protein TNCV_2806981 [Trichonephila clavipes]|nr:hypothetical protein TNCV_2806981 [Trichonephila clavipes]